MTITLEWWWLLPFVIAFFTVMRDLVNQYTDYPWVFWGWPLAAGILIGHFL
jgi:hypothetical protein